MILSSFAVEELALSRIISAAADKIQYISHLTGCDDCAAEPKDIPAMGENAVNLLETALHNQILLNSRIEKLLEYLPPPEPAPPSDTPPCLPPCHALPDACFSAVPGAYACSEPVKWLENRGWGCFPPQKGADTRIPVPRTGTLVIDLYLDTGGPLRVPGELQLIICCGDRPPIVQKLCPERQPSGCFAHARTVVDMPCGAQPCAASFQVCARHGMQLRQGRVRFVKA